jgi:hypothetical protein
MLLIDFYGFIIIKKQLYQLSLKRHIAVTSLSYYKIKMQLSKKYNTL